jgi:hypothetical protein
MDKISKVWCLSIFIFLILAIHWAFTFPATFSIPLDQSADKALAAGNITIFENYRGTEIKINETDVNNTITCSNLNTFIKEVGNGTVIKDVAVSSNLSYLTATMMYFCPKSLAENYNIYLKPTEVIKYVETETIAMPNYYERGSVASISAGEVKIRCNGISILLGIVIWTVIFALLSGGLLVVAEWCWGKCKIIKLRVASTIKGLKSKK